MVGRGVLMFLVARAASVVPAQLEVSGDRVLKVLVAQDSQEDSVPLEVVSAHLEDLVLILEARQLLVVLALQFKFRQ